MCQQWWESWGSRKHYLLKFSLEISPDKKEIKRRGMSCKNCADIGGKSCLARHVTWNMLLADLLGQITDNLIINWAISSEQSLIGVLEDIILQWYMSIFSQILNTDFQPRQYLILRMCFASYVVGLRSFEVGRVVVGCLCVLARRVWQAGHNCINYREISYSGRLMGVIVHITEAYPSIQSAGPLLAGPIADYDDSVIVFTF